MTSAQSQWLVIAFCLAMTSVVIAFDVCLYHAYGPDSTFSRAARRVFHQYPMVPIVIVFWLGLLVGHILLPCDR